MFAAMIKLRRDPASPAAARVPGGPRTAAALAGIGFVITALSIVLACVPAPDEPNKALAIAKTVGLSAVLLVIGAGVYVVGRGRARDARGSAAGAVKS
jgi:hypothetical protein